MSRRTVKHLPPGHRGRAWPKVYPDGTPLLARQVWLSEDEIGAAIFFGCGSFAMGVRRALRLLKDFAPDPAAIPADRLQAKLAVMDYCPTPRRVTRDLFGVAQPGNPRPRLRPEAVSVIEATYARIEQFLEREPALAHTERDLAQQKLEAIGRKLDAQRARFVSAPDYDSAPCADLADSVDSAWMEAP